MMKIILLSIAMASLTPSTSLAAEICNVCVDTPPEVHELYTGKGGSIDGHGHTEKLAKPLFTGPLFYSLDEGEKHSLPASKGVFFQIKDHKKHKLRILSESGKSWGVVRFDCAEYDFGTKIVFEKSGFYGPGWMTFPLPKNPKKCRWYSEKSEKD